MPSKTSKPEADVSESVVKSGKVVIDPSLLNDLERAGRAQTRVETNTVYEDRTDAPADQLRKEYEVKSETLGDGTILETYGDALDGSTPEAPEEAE